MGPATGYPASPRPGPGTRPRVTASPGITGHAGGEHQEAAMGVRVYRRDGRREEFGHPGDGEWIARRDQRTGTLLVAYLRAGRFEEVRRLYRSEDWARAEIS